MDGHSSYGSFEALTFGIGGQRFAVDANDVREILDLLPVTEVPGARPFLCGLVNVRGKVVALADLRQKFQMEPLQATVDTRIVVIEMQLAGEPTLVGLLADKVYEVTRIDGACIEQTPDIGMKWRSDFIIGIAKRDDDFIVIPDMARIFTAE